MPPVTRALTPSLLLLAAGLPLAASAAAVIVHVDPGGWLALPLAVRRGISRDALLYTAGVALIAAPLAGVAAATVRHGARQATAAATGSLAALAAVFTASSALLSVVVFGQSEPEAMRVVATSHATMFAVTFALAAFGALCGALVHDALDAAALSLLIVLIAGGGVLVAGASVGGAAPPSPGAPHACGVRPPDMSSVQP